MQEFLPGTRIISKKSGKTGRVREVGLPFKNKQQQRRFVLLEGEKNAEARI
jgi:hypothetical protein